MYFTGFADEAASDIDGQIRATKELGWQFIESRSINGTNIHDLPDADFEDVVAKLADSGVKINCFGSTIANWGKDVREAADFEKDLEQTRRAIPRMLRLGTKLVRIMSYRIIKERPLSDQMKEERFSHLRAITSLFLDAGIQPVHENCMNYGGQCWRFTKEILANVPGIKLVFDTGNPVSTADPDNPGHHLSSWDFYEHVRDDVIYIHIKDGRRKPDGSGTDWCFCGEGEGDVRRILADLVARDYQGGISIEPHVTAVFHDPTIQTTEEAKHASYVKYGRQLMDILKEIQK